MNPKFSYSPSCSSQEFFRQLQVRRSIGPEEQKEKENSQVLSLRICDQFHFNTSYIHSRRTDGLESIEDARDIWFVDHSHKSFIRAEIRLRENGDEIGPRDEEKDDGEMEFGSVATDDSFESEDMKDFIYGPREEETDLGGFEGEDLNLIDSDSDGEN